MIPKITHSRSQLFSYWNDFEDGASVFGVSCDTYPELFEAALPHIVEKAPNGWKRNAKGNCKYLWFPSDVLDDDEVEELEDWKERFEQYVLLGLNQHIEDYFNDELDFCMALDFNYTPGNGRTVYGEAEYQLKYQESRKHVMVLKNALVEAFGDLPLPGGTKQPLISHVPAKAGKCNVGRKLAGHVANELELQLLDAELTCPKAGLKGVPIDRKVPIWQKLYDNGCVELSDSVKNRTVVIIDDLYQSGSTIWMYAKHLKTQGASHVFGLACVKSLGDTDNQ